MSKETNQDMGTGSVKKRMVQIVLMWQIAVFQNVT